MAMLQERLPGILAGVGVLALCAAAGMLLVYGEANRWVLTAGAIGVVLIAYAALERPEIFTGAVTGREIRYGSNALMMTGALLGIIILINMLANRYSHRFDLTAGKEHTLSVESVEIARQVRFPIKATAFYSQGQGGQEELQNLFKRYQQHTDQLTLEFVDPIQNPGLARQMKVEAIGTTVLEGNGRRQTMAGASESELSSALLKIFKGEAKKVYWVTGHGEVDLDGFDRYGGSEAKRLLEQENFVVEGLTLAAAPEVPADAAVVVIAGARERLLPGELSALNNYIGRGGKLLLMVEPRSPGNPESVLRAWGLEVGNGFVVDLLMNLHGDVLTPLITRYEPNPVMKNIAAAERLQTAFPAATSLVVTEGTNLSLQVQTIARSSERSWLETDERIQYDDGKDRLGPLALAVTVTRRRDDGTTGERAVVIGTANFMTNAVLSVPIPGNRARASIPGNRDLFLNSVSWLAEENQLLSVREKSPTDRSIFLTGTQRNLVLYSTTLFLPLAVLALGGYVWWRRR